jgi:alpha-L-fucosidase
MTPLPPLTPDTFADLRYGMIVHYGVYSLLERGEWVLNRERIPPAEYRKLAERFTAEKFDADALCDLAVRAGMRYITFTTMHHDGFRMYDSKLNNFNAMKSAAHRDIAAEVFAAARKRNLRISVYHTLNSQLDKPDAVDALEDPQAYRTFIRNTHARFEEVVRKFMPFDVLWYDGWWPFNAEGWEAQKLNDLVQSIQPGTLFNGRNGLPGDFATPEGHLGAPKPWRPWEACMTLNNNWGYHRGDHDYKSPGQVVDMLATVAADRGNLLINVDPYGDGSIPKPTSDTLETVGAWLKRCGECIYDTDRFTYGLRERGDTTGDWCHHGPFTARGNNLYLLLRRWPGPEFGIGGLECKALSATLLGEKQMTVQMKQTGDRIVISGLPEKPTDSVCPVLKIECDRPPTMYLTAGLRVPKVPHPPYDPCPSDLAHG